MTKQILSLEDIDRSLTVHLKQIHSDPLIKMKKYDGCDTSLGPGIDKNGFPVTGLTESFTGPKEGNKIPKKYLGTRIEMEKLLDLEDGALKQNSKFWGSYSIKIGSDPVQLVLSEPHDLLKYLFALGQSNVANSQAEVGENSKEEFVLYSDEQVAKNRIEGRKALREAYVLSEKLDLEAKMKILAVYGEVVDSTSPNTIIDRLDEHLERDPEKFLKIAQDERLIIRALLSQVLDKGILTTKNGAYYHGDVAVGHTEDLAVEAIAKDSTLQTILKAKLSGDMDIISAALVGSSKGE